MSQPFTVDDLFLHQKIASLDAGPATGVAAAVRRVDRDADRYLSSIWHFPLDGGPPRQLTQGAWLDQSPRWSPDGQCLAFLSARGDGVQVHLLPADGGEARCCSRLPRGVGDLRWCPDGRTLLVTAAVAVNPELRGARGPAAQRGPNAPEVAWKLPYKSDGLGYLLDREIHLFQVDVATGEHRQLTDGNFDVLGFALSADGQQIASCRTREGRFAHRTDLWVSDAAGRDARQVTTDIATVLTPAWSPDGRLLAFAGAQEEGGAQNHLYVLDLAAGSVRRAGDADLEVADGASLRWIDGGRRILCVRAHRGCHQICSIAVDGSGLRVLVDGDRQFGSFASDGMTLAFSVEHPALPSELFACGIDGGGERQLSRLNAWWSQRLPVQAERRRFDVPDGRGGVEAIEGWLLRARGATGAQPVLDDVHGGPASHALLDFDTNVYWQVLCSQGWSVLALNAVGSSSYGREFLKRLEGRWGELDLPQHIDAIRQLEAAGLCDGRAAIAGKSYGGFFSAYAVARTQLFRAAVVMAPVGNIETHYGTSDGGYYADPLYVGSAPRFDRERARALSPLQSIEASRTPVLFLQGKEDERCPKCQSEEMFVSLMRAGDTPTELVLYPGEDHHFLGDGAPSARRDAADRIVRWVLQWSGHVSAQAEHVPEGSVAA